jgi:hypothetical protein
MPRVLRVRPTRSLAPGARWSHQILPPSSFLMMHFRSGLPSRYGQNDPGTETAEDAMTRFAVEAR